MEIAVLLIGGNSGIGLATAKLLLSYGINLTAASRSTDQLSALGIPVQLFDAEDPGQLDLPETLDGLIYFPGTINLKPFHLQETEKLTPFAFPLWASASKPPRSEPTPPPASKPCSPNSTSPRENRKLPSLPHPLASTV